MLSVLQSVAVNSLEQGLLFSFMALGVYLSFRILGFPDLTVEGSFPLGGAVAARIIFGGGDPFIATLVGMVAGASAGVATGLIHTRLKINNIIAGILTMTAVYTVMLRVMGRANIPLLSQPNVYTRVLGLFNRPENSYGVIVMMIGVVGLIALLFVLFLHTDIGVAIRAAGTNEKMIRTFGVNTDNIKVLTLALANGMAALSGALVAQNNGFADVGMGLGMLVVGAASIIIGESLFGERSVGWTVVAVLVGVVLYRVIVATALRVGFEATDLKLLTALLVLVTLSVPRVRQSFGW